MFVARLAVVLVTVSLLGACARNGVVEPPVDLGDFKMGLNIVVADNPQKVPISREASKEDLAASMKAAMEKRFSRYTGDKFYNFGVSIDAYALAPPGIPLVFSPKSALVVTAKVWDDAAGKLLNEKGEQFTVFEGVDGKTLVGSGLTQTPQQQLDRLTFNAARRIELWLTKHPEWFTRAPAAEAVEAATPNPAPVAAPDPVAAPAPDPAPAAVPEPAVVPTAVAGAKPAAQKIN